MVADITTMLDITAKIVNNPFFAVVIFGFIIYTSIVELTKPTSEKYFSTNKEKINRRIIYEITTPLILIFYIYILPLHKWVMDNLISLAYLSGFLLVCSLFSICILILSKRSNHRVLKFLNRKQLSSKSKDILLAISSSAFIWMLLAMYLLNYCLIELINPNNKKYDDTIFMMLLDVDPEKLLHILISILLLSLMLYILLRISVSPVIKVIKDNGIRNLKLIVKCKDKIVYRDLVYLNANSEFYIFRNNFGEEILIKRDRIDEVIASRSI